jgi:hypothetical protein
MNSLFSLLFLILAGKLESSFFNLDLIESEIESGSEGMPNITTSNVAAREIGFGQESLDKRSNDTASVTSDAAAFVASSSGHTPPIESPVGNSFTRLPPIPFIFETASASPYASSSSLSPATLAPPAEECDRNYNFVPSFDEYVLKATIRDKSIPFINVSPLEAADDSTSFNKSSELTPRASYNSDDILTAGDSVDHSSFSVRSSLSNDLPRILVSSLPSSSPLQLSSTLSGSLNNERVPKRTREETDNAVLDREIRDFIDDEVRSYRYRKAEKYVVLRKVIELIARNNYEEFEAYEPDFVAEFKCKYQSFKKGAHNADYMIHYIIRFGATNFLQSLLYCKKNSEFNEYSNIAAAFDHLIRTKPFEVAMEFIRAKYHMNCESVTKSISAAMEARYPNLHFLDFVVFEIDYSRIFLIKSSEYFIIMQTRNEEEKLKHFTSFLMNFSNNLFYARYGRAHHSYTRYLKTFFKYSEYFMSLKIDIRVIFAKLAILNEDLDSLSKIIEMDPKIILYNQFDSLFAFAARSLCSKTFQFFMDIVPEHATLHAADYSPIACSVLNDSLNNIKAFDDCGFDFAQDIRHSGNITTPIKLAFKSKSVDVFNFFIDKFGKEFIMAKLLQVYGSEYEIIQQASSGLNRTDKFLLILKNRLGINLK